MRPYKSENGTLSTGAKDLYKHDGAEAGDAMVTLANTSSSTPYTVNLTIKRARGGETRLLGGSAMLAVSDSIDYPGYGQWFVLEPGDTIRGYASTANVVDFYIGVRIP